MFTEDLIYYERTSQLMYERYYKKRLIILSTILLLLILASVILKEQLLINSLLGLILLAGIIYCGKKMQEFPEVYEKIKEHSGEIVTVVEDEYSYLIYQNQEKIARINKANSRNLPSQGKKYTLLLGFDKNIFAKEPFHGYFYDILEVTLEENYRLHKNGYSSLPPFLRRFTWRNLKSTTGSLVSFIFSNLFFLYILYRLVRYLISFLQMF